MAGQVLGRVQDSMSTLNGSLLVFTSVPLPLVLCYVENRTEETLATFVLFTIDDNICSSLTVNDGPNVQPGRFKLIVPTEVMGERDVYVAGRNCSNPIRSATFKVICKL